MNQKQKDLIAQTLGIPKNVQADLDAGSNHQYNCTCDTCARWWVHMGPDGGEPGKYGPFTREQIVATAQKMGHDISHLT